jgi:hypothetical protein
MRLHDDMELFSAKIGTWLWACAKAEAGEVMETLYTHNPRTGEEEWRPARHPHDAIHRNGRWRIKPKPVVPPTLEECLDALALITEAGAAWPLAQDILTRAGRLKGVK